MIRIRLLAGRKGYRRHVWAGVTGLVMAAVLLLGLYRIDQRYPLYKAWNDLISGVPEKDLSAGGSAGHPPAEIDGEVEVVPDPMEDHSRAVPEASPREEAAEEERKWEELVQEPASPEERAAVQEAEETVESGATGEEVAAAAAEKSEEAVQTAAPPQQDGTVNEPVEAVEPAASEEEGGPERMDLRRTPRLSTVCMQAFRLFGRVPSGMHFTALISDATGEYTIEGSSSSQELTELFLDTLKQLPSRAELSWLCNKLQAERNHKFKFALQGSFAATDAGGLKLLSPTEARSMFRQVVAWAKASGLGAVAFEGPIQVASPTSLVQQRQKMWARGSYRQISVFLRSFEQAGERASLGEMVVVPLGKSSQARLYTAVDVLVR